MAYTATGPEAQQDFDVGAGDTEAQDRVRQLHEQLLQGDILEQLEKDRWKISDLLHKDKRSEIFQSLMDKREEIFPGVEAKQLKDDLDALDKHLNEYAHELEYLQRVHENYDKDRKSPEKAGMLRSALERVKEFAKDHPVVVTLLAAAAVAAGVGGALYLSGALQLSQAGVATEALGGFIEGTDVINSGIGGMEGFQSLDGVPLSK
jgi:uncharacterized protein YhaN